MRRALQIHAETIAAREQIRVGEASVILAGWHKKRSRRTRPGYSLDVNLYPRRVCPLNRADGPRYGLPARSKEVLLATGSGVEFDLTLRFGSIKTCVKLELSRRQIVKLVVAL